MTGCAEEFRNRLLPFVRLRTTSLILLFPVFDPSCGGTQSRLESRLKSPPHTGLMQAEKLIFSLLESAPSHAHFPLVGPGALLGLSGVWWLIECGGGEVFRSDPDALLLMPFGTFGSLPPVPGCRFSRHKSWHGLVLPLRRRGRLPCPLPLPLPLDLPSQGPPPPSASPPFVLTRTLPPADPQNMPDT